MTLKELKENLAVVSLDHENKTVLIGGCDCLGKATGIRLYDGKNEDDEDETYVVIIRNGEQLS